MKTCYIIGAGEENKLDLIKNDGDMVIACDGGLRYVEKYGVTPDVIIGDFDSLGYVPDKENVIKLNVIKDETDVGAAFRIYGDKYDRFVLYCCAGGRISHTLANIQNALSLVEKNKEVIIKDKCENITFVHNGSIVLENKNGFFSVFSVGQSHGVTIKGAKYEVKDIDLNDDYPLGVSNEFCKNVTEIEVRNGTLIVVFGDA